MTTDTLIFKQANPPTEPFLQAIAAWLKGKYLHSNSAIDHGCCQVRPGNTRGEGVLRVLSPGCNGEIIYHAFAGGLYPTRKLF